jgi:hypothetical protein
MRTSSCAVGSNPTAALFIVDNSIGRDLSCYGGRFINPDNVALQAVGNDISGRQRHKRCGQPWS